MACAYVIAAGLLEIGWAIGLKYTDGFTRLWPSVWTAASMGISVWLPALGLKSIPWGPAMPGIGAAGTRSRA